jgi:hypothetical protein
MDAFLSLRVGSNPWLRLLPMLVFAAFLPAISVNAQSAATNASTNSSSTTMKTFVIIFRQGPRQLTDNEKQHRDEETKAWARQQNASGHKLDPHILAPEGERRGTGELGCQSSRRVDRYCAPLSRGTRLKRSHPSRGGSPSAALWGQCRDPALGATGPKRRRKASRHAVVNQRLIRRSSFESPSPITHTRTHTHTHPQVHRSSAVRTVARQ